MPFNKSERLITIILPAFNAEKFLSEAIESIISQTYVYWELIIINDGSTDRTAAIAQNFANQDSRIHLISQENQGVSAARNRGLEIATGKYICFVDADDYCNRDYLKKLYQHAIDKNADLVYCGIYFERLKCQHPSVYTEEDIIYQIYTKQNSGISIVSLLINKNFIQKNKISFDTTNHIGEDQQFVIQCLLKAVTFCVPETLYYYRDNPRSTTSEMKSVDLASQVVSLKKIYQFIAITYQGEHREEVMQHAQAYYRKRCSLLVPIIHNAIIQKKFEEAILLIKKIDNLPKMKTLSDYKRFILNTKSKTIYKIYRKILKAL